MRKEVDGESFVKIKKIHEVTNHKYENNVLYAYRNAGNLNDKIRQSIKNVVDTCEVCQKYKKSQGKPIVPYYHAYSILSLFFAIS
jgi:hypothetical protein